MKNKKTKYCLTLGINSEEYTKNIFFETSSKVKWENQKILIGRSTFIDLDHKEVISVEKLIGKNKWVKV